MEIKLIAMDLDGTALRDDHMTVSSRLLTALQRAHEKGIGIVPVTGRPYQLLPPFLKEDQSWKEYAILCNGSQLRRLDTGEVLYGLTVEGKDLEAILDLAQEHRVPVEFSADGRLYLTEQDMQAQKDVPELGFHCREILPKNGIVVDSLRPMCTHGAVEKVNLNGVPQQLRRQIEQGLAPLSVSGVWASGCSMEITHVAATKGMALRRLCSMLGILPEQVLALGDSGNDVSMLQMAGVGVAMGNAPEPVRQAAHAVTGTNMDDGAALAIEKFAL